MATVVENAITNPYEAIREIKYGKSASEIFQRLSFDGIWTPNEWRACLGGAGMAWSVTGNANLNAVADELREMIRKLDA